MHPTLKCSIPNDSASVDSFDCVTVETFCKSQDLLWYDHHKISQWWVGSQQGGHVTRGYKKGQSEHLVEWTQWRSWCYKSLHHNQEIILVVLGSIFYFLVCKCKCGGSIQNRANSQVCVYYIHIKNIVVDSGGSQAVH